MDKNIYVLEKDISSVDVDLNLETKLSALFLFFQEVSSYQSELLHIGKENTVDKNLHWVITRFNVEIYHMPRYEEKVRIMTYPGENNSLFFYRHFIIEDLNKNVLVRASSIWLIIDGNTHMMRKDPFNGLKLPIVHLPNELPLPSKASGEASNLKYTKRIKYSDIDLNNHLNNTRYIELIQDAIDINYYQDYKIKSILINYLAELKLDDEVEIYSNEDNPFTIIGRKNNKDHFIANLTFLPR